MKVAIDISQIIYGTGVSRYTKELINNLLNVDEKLSLSLFGGSLRRRQELVNFAKRLPRTTLKTFPIPPSVLHHLWNTLHLLPVEKIIGQADLVHTSDWTEPPSRLPKVTTVHDLSFLKDAEYTAASVRQVHKKRLYWVAKECAKVIAVSQATKNDLLNFLDLPSDRVEVVYEGPTMTAPSTTSPSLIEPILAKYGIKKPYFLVPGAGHPRKNIKRIIRAFESFSKYHLVIIGKPNQSELALVKTDSNIHFTGFVADNDLPYVFSQSELLLYPSLYEGFGLPILDAFTCSVPVITSSISSLPEVAGDAAILVDPASTEQIIDGIKTALKNPDKLIALGHAQLESFSWKKTAKETLNVYKAVINNQ